MKEQAFGFIYCTTNLVNGKKYIGQHTNFYSDYLGSGVIITKAINKYGKENFKREIVTYANSREELNEMEIYYIHKENSLYKNGKGYNLAEGGYSNPFAGFTDEMWEKQKEYAKQGGLAVSGENNGMFGIHRFGKENPNYGKKWSEDKKEVSKERVKIWWENMSEEEKKIHAKKAAAAKVGVKHGPRTEEQIKAMSEKRKNQLFNCHCRVCDKDFKGRSPRSKTCDDCKIK